MKALMCVRRLDVVAALLGGVLLAGCAGLPAAGTSSGAGAYAAGQPTGKTAEALRVARMLRDQGHIEGAVQVYARLDQRAELGPLELLEYAHVAAPIQTPQESLALFGKVRHQVQTMNVALQPAARAGLCVGLGRARMAMGQTDAALEDFECALSADANDVTALNAKGVLLDARGEHEAARALFAQAMAIAPADFRAMNNLALSHLAVGDAQQAISLLRQAGSASLPSLKLNLALAHVLNDEDLLARQTLQTIMPAVQVQQAMEDFVQRRVRIRAGAAVAQELLAASRHLLDLRERDVQK